MEWIWISVWNARWLCVMLMCAIRHASKAVLLTTHVQHALRKLKRSLQQRHYQRLRVSHMQKTCFRTLREISENNNGLPSWKQLTLHHPTCSALCIKKVQWVFILGEFGWGIDLRLKYKILGSSAEKPGEYFDGETVFLRKLFAKNLYLLSHFKAKSRISFDKRK